MKFPKKLFGFTVVLAILGLGAFGIYQKVSGSGEGEGETTEERTSDAPLPAVSANDLFDDALPVDVRGVPVVRDTLFRTVDATGQAAPWRSVKLQAQVSGQILSVPVYEGQSVSPNTSVVVMDSADYVMELEQRRAALAQAEARMRALLVGSDQLQLDPEARRQQAEAARNQAGVLAAEIAIERAKLDLSRTRVRPPFSGQIADIRVVPGQFVGQGTELATVMEMNPMKVEVQVLDVAITEIQRLREVEITFSAFPGEVFTGRIVAINPVVDGQARTARVTVQVPNPGLRIRPGMHANVRVPADRIPDVIMIPVEAIVERDVDRRTLVFVFEGEGDTGRAKWVYVSTGRRNNDYYELVDDPDNTSDRLLEPGEIVLVSGHKNLEHDARVRLGGGVTTVDGIVGSSNNR